MFQMILVPVDGSEPSNRAVTLSLDVARATGGRLAFLNIVNSDEMILDNAGKPFVDPQPEIDAVRECGAEALAAAAEAARVAGVQATIEQIDGEPVQRIVAFADE